MFGRSDEISNITALIDGAPAASGVVVVEGPAGIGKSSLLDLAMDHARRAGCAVRAARPTSAESTLGFSVLSDLLRGVDLRCLADPLRHALEVALGVRSPDGPPPTPAELGQALLHLLDARGPIDAPVLVVVDDLQWADPASRELIEFVGRRLPVAGTVLLAGWREEGGLERPLPDADRLRLGGLDDEAIEQTVRAALPGPVADAVVARLVAAAAGNPLFATELARGAGTTALRPGQPVPLPDSLRAAVANRVLPLPPKTLEALAAVALLARPTTATLDALGLLDDLRAAESARVLRVEGTALVVTHPLLASAAHDAVPGLDRLQLHARLAGVTEGVERSVHLALGSPQPDALVAAELTTAAEGLIARGASTEAAELAVLALDATPPLDDRRWDRMLVAADALFRCGRTDEAVAHLHAVRVGAATQALVCRALLDLAKIEYERNDDSAAAAALAREVLYLTDDADLLADAHTVLSFVIYTDFVEAAAHADAALQLIERRSEPDSARLASAINAAASAQFLAGGGLDLVAFQRAIDLEQGLPVPAADSAFGALAALLKYADELDKAREMLERLARDADPGSLPYALGHLPQVHLWTGRWDEAHQVACRHLELAERTGQAAQATMARFNLAIVAASRGDVAAARSIGTDLVVEGRDNGVPWTERNGAALLGFVSMSTNDAAGAVDMFSRYDRLGEEMRLLEPGYYRFHGDYVEALVATGDTVTAHDVLDRLAERSQRTGRPSGLAAAHRSRALLAATEGDRDTAFEQARQAVELLTATPLVFDRAKALLTEGVIARRFKDRGAGRRALAAALAEFERMGAGSLAERARRELERIAGRGPSTQRGDLALTATEQQVAELAAAGDTTRQIADALFISAKTVEANLTRIYRKLGVANRAQLATRLGDSERALTANLNT